MVGHQHIVARGRSEDSYYPRLPSFRRRPGFRFARRTLRAATYHREVSVTSEANNSAYYMGAKT